MQFDSDEDGNMWPEIVPPVINAPLNGIVGVLVSLGLAITLGAYQSGYAAHAATDFEIRDTATGNVVWSSLNNAINLLGLIVPALTLSAGKTYRIRARFRGGVYISEWSDGVLIST